MVRYPPVAVLNLTSPPEIRIRVSYRESKIVGVPPDITTVLPEKVWVALSVT